MATFNSTQYQAHVTKRTTGAHAPQSAKTLDGKWRYRYAHVDTTTDPATGATPTLSVGDTYNLFEIPASRILWMRLGWSGAIGAAATRISVKTPEYTAINLDGSTTTKNLATYFASKDASQTITAPYEYYNMATGTWEIESSTEPVILYAEITGAALSAGGKFWVDVAYNVE